MKSYEEFLRHKAIVPIVSGLASVPELECQSMTAAALSSLLHGKRIGRGKWVARCPAHPDRHPSLSIAEGKTGVLLKCMSAGCETSAVLEALGLRWSDLFYESRNLSRVDLRKLEAQRKVEADKERAQKYKARIAIGQARFWDAEVERVAKLLATDFDSDRLAAQFHRALQRSRETQAAIRPFFHPCLVPGEYL